MQLRKFFDRIALKRQPPGNHLKQRYAEAVNIAPGIQFFAAELLRAHIRRTAGNLHSLVPFRLIDRESEIRQLHDAVISNHDIVRLDITVDQPHFVPCVIKSLGDLLRNMESFVNGNPPFLSQTRPQIFAADISHCHVTESVILANRIRLDKVGMGEFCGGAGFPEESVDSLGCGVFR